MDPNLMAALGAMCDAITAVYERNQNQAAARIGGALARMNGALAAAGVSR